MIYILVALISIVLIVDILLIVLWKRDQVPHFKNTPRVSILIAARNEESNIGNCLKSILSQNYPKSNIQLLVGDDNSEDNTFEIASGILTNHKDHKILKIEENIAHQRGKANVLAQLAHHATTDFLFITDADMVLPSDWLKTMVNSVEEDTGIVTGVTYCKSNLLQGIDWIFALGMVKVLANLNIPVTTMGNNMLITRHAYNAIGGYESIPFSITEDLEIFMQVNKKGFKTKQLYIPQSLGETEEVVSFSKLMIQRKRWMIGAMQLPFPIVMLLFFQAIYFPASITLLFFNYNVALSLIVIKTLIQSIYIIRCIQTLELKISILIVIKYEFYSWVVALGTIIFYLLPVKVRWKGRKY